MVGIKVLWSSLNGVTSRGWQNRHLNVEKMKKDAIYEFIHTYTASHHGCFFPFVSCSEYSFIIFKWNTERDKKNVVLEIFIFSIWRYQKTFTRVPWLFLHNYLDYINFSVVYEYYQMMIVSNMTAGDTEQTGRVVHTWGKWVSGQQRDE